MELPFFIDIEASGLGPASYPIEIGWSDAQARVESVLIDRTSIGSTLASDHRCRRTCMTSLDLLLKEGVSPVEVWSRLIEVCGRGATLYSGSVEFDRLWLADLAGAAGDGLGAMRLRPASELIRAAEPSPYLDALLYPARAQLDLRQHRAADDVRALRCAYLKNRRYRGLGELTDPMPMCGKRERVRALVSESLNSGVSTRTMTALRCISAVRANACSSASEFDSMQARCIVYPTTPGWFISRRNVD